MLQLRAHFNAIVAGGLASLDSEFRTNNLYIVVEFLKLHREDGGVARVPLFMLVERMNRRGDRAICIFMLTRLLTDLLMLVYLVIPVIHIRSVIADPVCLCIFIIS